MIRTQIYLNDSDKEAIRALCINTGMSQSEIIRKAISFYVREKKESKNFDKLAFGIWKDNDFDYRKLRTEFDRF